jgi:hypothetical protein
MNFLKHPVPCNNGEAWEIRFCNGYGASIVRSKYSYGGSEGLFEVAILKDGSLYFSTPITNDILGWLTEEEVNEICKKISELPEDKFKILNFTPHDINLCDENGNQLITFPPTGLVRLSVKTVVDEIASSLLGVCITKSEFGEPIGLPDFKKDTFLIVSQLVKSALPEREDLLVPAEVVRDLSGNIIGCKSLGR